MNISWETQHEQRYSWLLQNWISMDDDNPQVKQVGGNHQPGGVLNMVQELDRKNMEFHYREVSASMGRWPTYVMRFMRKKTYIIHHNGRIASCGHMSSNKMYNCVFPLPVLYLINIWSSAFYTTWYQGSAATNDLPKGGHEIDVSNSHSLQGLATRPSKGQQSDGSRDLGRVPLHSDQGLVCHLHLSFVLEVLCRSTSGFGNWTWMFQYIPIS